MTPTRVMTPSQRPARRAKFFKSALLLGTGLTLALSAGQMAVAQDEDRFAIEEIIVTSTKRAESLQEVPMAITVLDEFTLERMGANTFIDYASKVPNLGYGAEADGRFDSRKIGIRGVFGAALSSIAGTTGFYIDDTPIPETMNPRVLDVERVEVLKGPQGTLYGARSMGGTVRLISKQPDLSEQEARARANVSTVDEGDVNFAIDAAINVPVIEDVFAIRAMAYTGANSGLYERISLTNAPGGDFFEENVDDEKYMGAQIAATFVASENLTITPRFMYQKLEADGLPFADLIPGNFRQFRNFNIEEPGSEEWWLTSLTVNYEADFGSFTSSTAFFDRFIDEDEDETFVITFFFGTPPLYGPLTETLDFEAFVHETRFTSEFDGPFQFTAGVFYQDTNSTLLYPTGVATVPGLDEAFSRGVLGLPPGVFALGTDLIFETNTVFNTEEFAIFGELSYDITDWLTATAGARWSDTKAFFLSDTDGLANNGPSFVEGTQSESSFNPKFQLEARVNDDVMTYASVSKGFRIGGVNQNVPFAFCAEDLALLGITSPEDILGYDSDTVWSYEGGVKSTLLDRRVTLNAAAFFIEWNDMQQLNRLSCGFQLVANAGKAENKGFEIEMVAHPVDGLEFVFGVGYTDAKIVVGNPAAGLFEGSRVQQVPRWNMSLSTQYTKSLGDDWSFFFRNDYSYFGNSFSANNEPQNPRERPAWSIFNARVGVFNGTWETSVFVNNMFNEYANLADNRSIAAEHPDRPRIVTNRPRTIGMEVRMQF